MPVEIKEFEEHDRESLRRIYFEVRKKNFSWLNKALLELSSFDGDTEGEFILVAHIETERVGFISLWLPDNFIHHLFISDDHQRKGIGMQLLAYAIQKLDLPVTLKCVKQNVSAVNFYKKNGWHEKSHGVSDDGEYILFEYSDYSRVVVG